MTRISILKSFLYFLTALVLISCKEDGNTKKLEFYKVNIVSPNPKATFDSIRNKYELPVYWDYEEGNGYASGGLSLSNGFLDIKTYYDSSITAAAPMELVLNSSLPDSVTYENLNLRGLQASKPFRMEGWFWSIVSINDLQIMGDKSNGVYVTHYDDYDFHRKSTDSIQNLTDRRIDSILIFSDKADKLNANWNKIDLEGSPPIVSFVKDSIDRIELIIK